VGLVERCASDPQTKKAIADLNVVPAFLNATAFANQVKSDASFHAEVLRKLGAL
jgi:tripartite-type tricarboxylate transporter receptor subunit TctC